MNFGYSGSFPSSWPILRTKERHLCCVSSFLTCELVILIYLINGIGKLNFLQQSSDRLIQVTKFV